MKDLFRPPLRNLTISVLYMLVVTVLATAGYTAAGWNLDDALYMVVLTIYTVGYEEVHPIATPLLRDLTMTTIVLGCTGMIFLTGSLVQFITINQLQLVFGTKRMQSQIDKLKDHVIVCGFGRIGQMLAHELKAGAAQFVILERSDSRAAEARNLGYQTVQADATDEGGLKLAGIDRARALATVLPDDAANVFITLSARSLNRSIEIIARGEVPSTEKKLRHAGADKVVLPTHIGAERIAEMILYPETARYARDMDKSRDFERTLNTFGLQMDIVVADEAGGFAGSTVAEIERRGNGAFFVVQLKHRSGKTVDRPPADMRVEAGDGVVVVGREGLAAAAG
ncbi:MAG: potassium channel protein [Rhodospirillales bacterium]|nr:potassium channel protein [Rhodospirillales bacterium]